MALTEDDSSDRVSSPELEAEIDSRLAEVRAPEGAVIVVVDGEEPGRVYPLGRTDRTIGRAPTVDVCIDEPAVSQLHARIFVQNGRYRIADLGSTNGTFVNGDRIGRDVVLHTGDVVRVGETELQYLLPPADGGPAPTLVLHDARRPSGHETGMLRPGRAGAGRSMSPPDEPGLRELIVKLITAYRFVHRHRWALIAFACAGTLLGGVTVFVEPPVATASFEMRLKAVETPNPMRPYDRNVVDVSDSMTRDFTARPLVRSTLEQLEGAEPSQARLAAVLGSLKLDGAGPRTYRGTFADPSADRAKALLGAHLDNFIAAEVDEMVEVARAEADFLRGLLAKNERELRKTEGELSAFKQEHLEGLPDHARSQFETLVDLRARETSLVSDIERVRLELELARKRLSSDESTLERRVETTQPYRDAIVEARRKLGSARARGLAEEHPEVVGLRREVAELEELNQVALDKEITDAERRTDRALRGLRADVAELEVKLAAAEKELGQVRDRVARTESVVRKLPKVEERFAELSRSYESLQELHAKLFQQLKAAEVKLEFERASAVARYDVTQPLEVASPSMRRVAALRSALGAVLGVLVALAVAGSIELRRYVRRLAV